MDHKTCINRHVIDDCGWLQCFWFSGCVHLSLLSVGYLGFICKSLIVKRSLITNPLSSSLFTLEYSWKRSLPFRLQGMARFRWVNLSPYHSVSWTLTSIFVLLVSVRFETDAKKNSLSSRTLEWFRTINLLCTLHMRQLAAPSPPPPSPLPSSLPPTDQ